MAAAASDLSGDISIHLLVNLYFLLPLARNLLLFPIFVFLVSHQLALRWLLGCCNQKCAKLRAEQTRERTRIRPSPCVCVSRSTAASIHLPVCRTRLADEWTLRSSRQGLAAANNKLLASRDR